MVIVGEWGINAVIWQDFLQSLLPVKYAAKLTDTIQQLSDSQIHLNNNIMKVTLAALAKHEATSPGLRPTSLRPFIFILSPQPPSPHHHLHYHSRRRRLH